MTPAYQVVRPYWFIASIVICCSYVASSTELPPRLRTAALSPPNPSVFTATDSIFPRISSIALVSSVILVGICCAQKKPPTRRVVEPADEVLVATPSTAAGGAASTVMASNPMLVVPVSGLPSGSPALVSDSLERAHSTSHSLRPRVTADDDSRGVPFVAADTASSTGELATPGAGDSKEKKGDATDVGGQATSPSDQREGAASTQASSVIPVDVVSTRVSLIETASLRPTVAHPPLHSAQRRGGGRRRGSDGVMRGRPAAAASVSPQLALHAHRRSSPNVRVIQPTVMVGARSSPSAAQGKQRADADAVVVSPSLLAGAAITSCASNEPRRISGRALPVLVDAETAAGALGRVPTKPRAPRRRVTPSSGSMALVCI